MPDCQIAKGVNKLEKLNIEGKRSGSGFVAHKATLVNALSRAVADRVTLMDFTIGRKGLLGYLKSLNGSNIVKVAPFTDSASETQAVSKRLKVVCGANISQLDDGAWIGDNTPMTLCEVRVTSRNAVTPNIGSLELAEALSRVLPFTATEDTRPVLQCVLFTAKEGKLTLVSADGFRLAVVSLDYDGEGEVLISREDLAGIANALRSAKRARVSFEGEDIKTLTIDTELIRYQWVSDDGKFPDWERLIPTEAKTTAHFDTVEAGKAIGTLRALADNKSYPIDITLDNGVMVLANPDDKGQATMPADIEGEANRVRLDGSYLAEALKACGGMPELKLTDGKSPVLFTTNGYKLVVMPMLTSEHTPKAEGKPEAEAESEGVTDEATEAEPEPEPEVEVEIAEPETEAETKPKAKRKGKVREPVAVA
ncbi:MAG: DNA polymerase III subunit beta [Dehalococcoidales bacterium]|nr:DNA polymerase III subunit beta [Dehalococcoidales bacterium]